MNTAFQVTKNGQTLATVAKREDGSHWASLKALMAANPGSDVTPVVTITDACDEHPAYEASNCPRCGTNFQMSN